MDDQGRLDVDDIVSEAAAAQLGPGVIPVSAVLIVEVVTEEGPGLRFVRSPQMPSWQAIGMTRSTLRYFEHEDLKGWDPDSDPGSLD